MAGKNFPTSKEDVLVPTYYLDIDGLAGFWAKAKQYINNQNLSLNGQNIPLYPRGTESNISITSAINDIKSQYVKDVSVYVPENDYISCTVTPDTSTGADGEEGKQTKIALNVTGLTETLDNVVLHDEVSPIITAENNQLTINVAGHESNTVSMLTTQVNVLSSVEDMNYPLVGTENKTTGGSGQPTVRNLYIQAEKNTDGSIAQSELYINPSKKLVAAPNIKSNNILSSLITSRSYEDTLHGDHDEIIIGNNGITFSNKTNNPYRFIKFAGPTGLDTNSWSIQNSPGPLLEIAHTHPARYTISSNVVIMQASSVVGNQVKYDIGVAGNIIPNPQKYTSETIDIGTVTQGFDNGYFVNGYFRNGTFSTKVSSPLGQFNLLDAAKIKTGPVWANGKYYPLVLQPNNDPESGYYFGYMDLLSFDQVSKTVNIGGNNGIEYCPSTYSLNPVDSGSKSLGTSSKKWQEIYVENIRSHGSSYFKDVTIQSYAWPADLTIPYQAPVTNGYIRNIINTSDLSQYGIPHDPTQDYLEIGLEDYTTFTDEGVMSEYPASPLKIYRDKLYFQDTCIVGQDGEIGLKDHTHAVTYTPSGTVSSSFSDGTVSVNASSDTTTVKSVTSVGSVPSRASKTMPKSTHTHAVTYTPSGSVNSTFSNGSVSVSASSDTTTVKSVTSVGSVPSRASKTMPKSTHTHAVTYTPSGSVNSTFSNGSVSVNASSGTTTVKSIMSVGSTPTRASKSMPKSTHTHAVTYIPSGTVNSSFSNGSVSVNASSGTTTVKSVTSVGSTPTRASKSMPKSTHTHAVTYTPSGTVNSTFSNGSVSVNASSGTTTVASSGHTHTASESGLGVSYSEGVLSITTSHSHTINASSGTTSVASSGHTHTGTVAGTVTSTFTGTEDTVTTAATPNTECETIYSIESVGSTPTTEDVTVASSGHTHTGTVTGTVTSTFTGTEGTATAAATLNAECEEIFSIESVGSAPTTKDVTVASSGHTHTGTVTGTVTSTFTGTENTVTTAATQNTECETIYSIESVGSVPTTEDVTVASSGHTHTGTATGTVTSTFAGTEDTATAAATPNTECETIYSIESVGSVPTTEDVTVASSGHTHTGTVTGTVTSTFTGSEDTVTSDFVS